MICTQMCKIIQPLEILFVSLLTWKQILKDDTVICLPWKRVLGTYNRHLHRESLEEEILTG